MPAAAISRMMATLMTVVTFWKTVLAFRPRVWSAKNERTTARARSETDPRPPARIRMYSAIATALAAPLKPRVTSSSDQPATNPMVSPQACRAYTYLPPASGSAAAISPSTNVESATTTPPKNQRPRTSQGSPRYPATSPGGRRIPAPITMPTVIDMPSRIRRTLWSRGPGGASVRASARVTSYGLMSSRRDHGGYDTPRPVHPTNQDLPDVGGFR